MGYCHPSASITGIDIVPDMITWVPPNVTLIVDNIEDDWNHPPNSKHFIHMRWMGGSTRNCPALFRQCFTTLEPGGILEVEEPEIGCYSEDGSLSDFRHLSTWIAQLHQAEEKPGRSAWWSRDLQRMVRDAGFDDVQACSTILPLGEWMQDDESREIGRLNMGQFLEGLEGTGPRLLIDKLGWQLEEVQVLLAGVRSDLRDIRLHAKTKWLVFPPKVMSESS